MTAPELAIATMTLARSPVEEALLREGIARLAGLSVPVVVADGGSPSSFTQAIATYANISLLQPHRNGLFPQMASSLTAAYHNGAPTILYTEPDKLTFFQDRLPELMMHASASEPASLLIPGRDRSSFQTFPKFQQDTESMTNRLVAKLTRRKGDYSYGPFTMPRELVPYVVSLPDDIGWGWRFFVFGLANRLEYELTFLPQVLPCPEEQRGEQDRLHRLKQFAENLRGLHLALALTDDEISRMEERGKGIIQEGASH